MIEITRCIKENGTFFHEKRISLFKKEYVTTIILYDSYVTKRMYESSEKKRNCQTYVRGVSS